MSLLVSFGLEHLPPLMAPGEASGWATALSAGVSDFGSFSQFQALKRMNPVSGREWRLGIALLVFCQRDCLRG